MHIHMHIHRRWASYERTILDTYKLCIYTHYTHAYTHAYTQEVGVIREDYSRYKLLKEAVANYGENHANKKMFPTYS